MTTMRHAHSPRLTQGRGIDAAGVSAASSHVAIIMRFAKFAAALALIAIAVAAIVAIRVVAWFPPFR
jgi:hypothetical protein